MRLRTRRAVLGPLSGIGKKWPRTAPLRGSAKPKSDARNSEPRPSSTQPDLVRPAATRQTATKGRLNFLYASASGGGSPIAEHNSANGGAGRCGFLDWRLPSRRKLRSLVDRSQADAIPPVRSDYLPNIVAFFYWSNELYPPDSTRAWAIDFSIGAIRPGDRRHPAHAILVRGGR